MINASDVEANAPFVSLKYTLVTRTINKNTYPLSLNNKRIVLRKCVDTDCYIHYTLFQHRL